MEEETKSIWKRLVKNRWSDRILFVLAAFIVFLTLVTQVPAFQECEAALLIIAAIVSLAAGIIVVAIACLIRNSSSWHLAWTEPRRFFGWLTLFSLAGLTACYVVFLNSISLQTMPDWLRKTVLSATATLLAGFAIGFVCMVLAWISPVRRLLAWLLQRRFFVLACLVTLVALFYAEENWRGKRAWDNYRHEWEAKGEHFGWEAVVPSPVPDDQNFALAPIWVESMKAVLGPKNSRQWFGNNYAENGRTNFTDRLAMSIYREGDYGGTNMNSGSWQKAKLADLKPWQDYYRHPKTDGTKPNAVVTNEFPVSPQPQTSAADVLLALSKYDSTLEELREAAKLPYARFPLNYSEDKPFDDLLPHLSKSKAIAQFLNLRAIAELEADQPGKALADLKLGFRCNDPLRNEPFLISHLVHMAVQNILMQPVWQGLAQQKWSDAQLAELESELRKLDYLADFHQAMRGERAGSIAMIDYLRRTRSYQNLLNVGGVESENINPASFLEMLAAVGWHLIPAGQFYQTELAFAQMHERWNLPAVDLPKRLVSPTANARLAEGFHKAMPTRRTSVKNILVGMLFPALEKAQKKFALIQSTVNLARVAIALERYRLAHGQYSDSLGALAPQFIAQVPHDLINGQPLKYRREANGQFILYSVGWNEKDEGGVIVLRKANSSVDTDQGDWVWQYPAK